MFLVPERERCLRKQDPRAPNATPVTPDSCFRRNTNREAVQTSPDNAAEFRNDLLKRPL
jgi:hypothetical protein